MNHSNDKNINYYGTIKGHFSLIPLIKFWEKASKSNKAVAASYDYIKKKLDEVPELMQPIHDSSLIETHRELIEELLTICISPSIDVHEYYSAVYFDRLEPFYETPAFSELGFFANQMRSDCFNENCCLTPEGRVMAVYSIILSAFYKLKINYEYPIIYTKQDEKTGLERYYRIRIFSWFCELRAKQEINPLTDLERKRLFDNLDNTKILMEMIPPELFEAQGFLIYNAVEITDQETISSLKFDLIGKESLTSENKFKLLQHKLRVLLKKPNLKLGLIGFPSGKKDLENAVRMGNSIILRESFTENNIASECNIYSEVLDTRAAKLIYDVKDYSCSERVEKELLDGGIRNLLVAPLFYKEEIIGILELASSISG